MAQFCHANGISRPSFWLHKGNHVWTGTQDPRHAVSYCKILGRNKKKKMRGTKIKEKRDEISYNIAVKGYLLRLTSALDLFVFVESFALKVIKNVIIFMDNCSFIKFFGNLMYDKRRKNALFYSVFFFPQLKNSIVAIFKTRARGTGSIWQIKSQLLNFNKNAAAWRWYKSQKIASISGGF